ncbi:MAG: GNAT family N-acetyltransferase [Actinomycetota bacterium]|nr:GNAT family N-acetyltransferase [Actinomycetota bacterium]
MSLSGLEMRPITSEEYPAFYANLSVTFGENDRADEREFGRSILELERTLAVFDNGQVVAGAAIYSLSMALAGGPAPVAGVTWVGVRPTHRRRGLLTAMMTRQLAELHEAGEPVAALWAAESSIYGRFGYGLASQRVGVRLRRGESSFVQPFGAAAPLRLGVPADLRPDLRQVYDGLWTDRVGCFARTAPFWENRLYDAEYQRDGATPLLAVVSDSPGGPDGYALYATKEATKDSLPAGRVLVREVMATSPATYARLWRYLLDIDLMADVVADNLPVDDPLPHLLRDPRRARLTLKDGLWVRLVDVDRALANRSFGGPVDLVLEVTDESCPWNAGRWHLCGDSSGATCTRTDAPAELALSATELGAAYLGGTSLVTLGGAGRVEEHRRGALAAAARAFAVDPLPWCPLVF